MESPPPIISRFENIRKAIVRLGMTRVLSVVAFVGLIGISVAVATLFPNFRGDLRQRADYGSYCGGDYQGYCVNDGKPVCNAGFHVSGGDCVRDGATDRNDQIKQDQKAAEEKAKEAVATPTVRYGVTDNLCHLPGANCTTDEDWRKGFAAARGDAKAAQALADAGHIKIDQNGNPVAITTQSTNSSGNTSGGTGGTSSGVTSGQISEVAKDAMSAALKNNVGGVVVNGCNVNLGLCPMINPADGKTMGWVPSDKPVYGTFDQAMQARQNLSIGDLFVDKVTLVDGTTVNNVYDFNWQSKTADELGAVITDQNQIAALKAIAEKNKIQTDAKGYVVTNQQGDILTKDGGILSKATFEQNSKDFYKYQNEQLTKIQDSIVKDGKYTDAINTKISECAKTAGCDPKKMADNLPGLELLSTAFQDSVKKDIASKVESEVKRIEAVKNNTEYFKTASTQQLIKDICGGIDIPKEKDDCARNVESEALAYLGITGDDAKEALAERKVVVEKVALDNKLGVDFSSLTDEELKTKYCSDRNRREDTCGNINSLRYSLLDGMDAKTRALWVDQRNLNLSAQKFGSGYSVDDLASKACEGLRTPDRLDECRTAEKARIEEGINSYLASKCGGIINETTRDDCQNNERENALKQGLLKSTIIARLPDDIKGQLVGQVVGNIKVAERIDNAASAFQGVQANSFTNLESDVDGRLAEIRDRIRKESLLSGCTIKDRESGGRCYEPSREEIIAGIVNDKQNQVYVDKCKALGGGDFVCNSTNYAKQYLLGVANPNLTASEIAALAEKLNPSLGTATDLAAKDKLTANNNFGAYTTAVGTVVGNVATNVGTGLGNAGVALQNYFIALGRAGMGVTQGKMVLDWGELQGSEFVALDRVDPNVIINRTQQEAYRTLVTTSNGVYFNPEEAARFRIEDKLANLGPQALADAQARVAAGSSWSDVESGYWGAVNQNAATWVVGNWNNVTGGRFKRGNDAFLEATKGEGLGAVLPGGAAYRNGGVDTGQAIRGALAQGGDAAAVVTAIVAVPVGGFYGLTYGAALQTGVLGTAVTTQMTGMAADVCEMANKGQVSQSQCINTTALAVMSGLGTVTGVVKGAGALSAPAGNLTNSVANFARSGTGSLMTNAMELSSQALGFTTFTGMTADACNNKGDVHCLATATMALSSFGGLVSKGIGVLPGAGADAAEALAAGLHKTSALAFVGSACLGAVDSISQGNGQLDGISMCAMALHGGIEAVKPREGIAVAKTEETAKLADAKAGRGLDAKTAEVVTAKDTRSWFERARDAIDPNGAKVRENNRAVAEIDTKLTDLQTKLDNTPKQDNAGRSKIEGDMAELQESRKAIVEINNELTAKTTKTVAEKAKTPSQELAEAKKVEQELKTQKNTADSELARAREEVKRLTDLEKAGRDSQRLGNQNTDMDLAVTSLRSGTPDGATKGLEQLRRSSPEFVEANKAEIVALEALVAGGGDVKKATGDLAAKVERERQKVNAEKQTAERLKGEADKLGAAQLQDQMVKAAEKLLEANANVSTLDTKLTEARVKVTAAQAAVNAQPNAVVAALKGVGDFFTNLISRGGGGGATAETTTAKDTRSWFERGWLARLGNFAGGLFNRNSGSGGGNIPAKEIQKVEGGITPAPERSVVPQYYNVLLNRMIKYEQLKEVDEKYMKQMIDTISTEELKQIDPKFELSKEVKAQIYKDILEWRKKRK